MGGKAYKQDTRVHKIWRQAVEEKKVFFGNTEVFSSSHDVFYHSDVDDIIVKEIEDETDIISQAPEVFKEGWVLVGWRQDTEPNPDVLEELLALDDDMHVYAVYQKDVIITLQGGEELILNSGIRYYNNSNYKNPWIKLGTASLPEWQLIGYRDDMNPDPNVTYMADTNYEFTETKTIYAVFQKVVTLFVTAVGDTTTYPRIRYKNNENYDNPVVVIADPHIDDADFLGYSAADKDTTIVNRTLSEGIALSEDTYRFAVWHYHDATLWTYSSWEDSVRYVKGSSSTSTTWYGSVYTLNGNKYVQAQIYITNANVYLGRYQIINHAGIGLVNGPTLRSRHVEGDTIGPGGEPVTHKSWDDPETPWTHGPAWATVSIPDASSYTIMLAVWGILWTTDGNVGSIQMTEIKGIGRTTTY